MEANRILVVEDDRDIREGIEIYLRNQGYVVFQAGDGVEGLEIIRREEIHLAIVDIMMPRMDGITMMMKVRDKGYDFPVIMLSAKSEEVDKIMGLNMGADDYVTKPFTTMELLARVNSHLRRYSRYLDAVNKAAEPENDTYHCLGGIEVNEETVEVFVDGNPVKLTPIEFKILLLLIKIRDGYSVQMKYMNVSGTKKQSTQILLWSISAKSGRKSKSILKIRNI